MTEDRYARQTGLTGFGEEAQRMLAASSVLIIGAGGLGVPAATYLAAMGVGRIGIVDDDRVAASNLHRQVAYTPADVGELKAEVLARRLRAQNPGVSVDAFARRFDVGCAVSTLRTQDETSEGVAIRFQDFDVVVDASDNFPTRYLVSDACVLHDRPLVFGAAQGFEGQVSTFNLGQGAPTYRCLFPEDPANAAIPDCAVGGVLGVLPGIVGTYQALEAVKVITGVGSPLDGRLLLIDGLTGGVRNLKFAAQSTNRAIDQSTVMARHAPPEEVGCSAIETFIGRGEEVIDVRGPEERARYTLDGATHVPLQALGDWLRQRRPTQRGRVLFVCASGKRSAVAAKRYNLATNSWKGLTASGGLNALRSLRS